MLVAEPQPARRAGPVAKAAARKVRIAKAAVPAWATSAVVTPPAQDAERQRIIHDHPAAGLSGQRLQPDSHVRQGMRIWYYRELEEETPIPFEEEILFRDDHLLVVDKPHFVPMIPTGRFLRETLLVRLKRKLDLPHLTPIHRLDRERRLLAALEDGVRGDDDLLATAWSDAPAQLRPAAALTMHAHLRKLAAEDRLPAGVSPPAPPGELPAI